MNSVGWFGWLENWIFFLWIFKTFIHNQSNQFYSFQDFFLRTKKMMWLSLWRLAFCVLVWPQLQSNYGNFDSAKYNIFFIIRYSRKKKFLPTQTNSWFLVLCGYIFKTNERTKNGKWISKPKNEKKNSEIREFWNSLVVVGGIHTHTQADWEVIERFFSLFFFWLNFLLYKRMMMIKLINHTSHHITSHRYSANKLQIDIQKKKKSNQQCLNRLVNWLFLRTGKGKHRDAK